MIAGNNGAEVKMFDIAGKSTPKKVAFLSSFPPRQCGIATFSHDVITAVVRQVPDCELIVIAMGEPDSQNRQYPEMVKFV